ncbi:hypothetical protein ABGB18_07440 [Nonomuraea sp. B12E4]|uniref:hypothetical protein n=1 Tax=Nonomuraea sp. B12E4 TaxID=3153564 RepID=UPI00325E79F0
MKITFPAAPTLGSSGAIEIRRADGALADRIEAATAKTDKKNIGRAISDTGLPHDRSHESIMIDGNSANVYLHRQVDHGQDYYVTVDPDVFTGFDGVSDARTWRFKTRKQPHRPAGSRLKVSASGDGDFCTVQGAIDAVPTGNQRR